MNVQKNLRTRSGPPLPNVQYSAATLERAASRGCGLGRRTTAVAVVCPADFLWQDAARRPELTNGRRAFDQCAERLSGENEGAHVTEPIAISYGRGHLTLRMPAKAEVTMIAKGKLNKIVDPAAAVRRALADPIDSPALVELARGRKSACILICDITRPVPNHLFLRPIIETLVASGIALDRIVILVATGLHRPNVGEELAELVGDPWVKARVRIENHDARNDADHVDLGQTATRGTPIKLDRRFVEADLRIATSLVEPHFMAGWSGGRKVVAPGVAGHETIRTFHSARFMEDPL